jgi:hypothetical protein
MTHQPHDEERNKVLQEILQTERTYVNNMNRLKQVRA